MAARIRSGGEASTSGERLREPTAI
ncbi:MAG: hypothetical protein QOJ56_1920, partial [Mycobacterium sp.]|nr:hypothetical protein [Mycobacterium sp.]